MLPLVAPSALAATVFQVGLDVAYPDVGTAVRDAVDGDIIEIYGPETYAESVNVHDLNLTFVGFDDPQLRSTNAENGFLRVRGDSVVDIATVNFVGGGVARAFRVSESAVVGVTDSTVRETGGGFGGGAVLVEQDASLTLTRVAFVDSYTYLSGGFVLAEGTGTLVAVGSTFTNGYGEGGGGAIHCDIDRGCTFTDCTFSGNSGGSGGAVMTTDAGLTVTGSRFCGNTAGNMGGALLLFGSSTIRSSVFGGNNGVVGGAIHMIDDLVLEHCDFLDNGANDTGGAINVMQGHLQARHDLFVGHDFGRQVITVVGGASASLDYTLYDDNTVDDSNLGSGSHPVHGDPRFTDYDGADCLGAVLTLEPGSLAIDAGNPAEPDLDGTAADIGAFGPACLPREEIPANGIDEDCDGYELCYADTDGDGLGEAGTEVESLDLECPPAGNRCPDAADQEDGDADGVPDGCDPEPNTPSGRGAPRIATGGHPAGCACRSASEGGLHGLGLLVALLLWWRRTR